MSKIGYKLARQGLNIGFYRTRVPWCVPYLPWCNMLFLSMKNCSQSLLDLDHYLMDVKFHCHSVWVLLSKTG